MPFEFWDGNCVQLARECSWNVYFASNLFYAVYILLLPSKLRSVLYVIYCEIHLSLYHLLILSLLTTLSFVFSFYLFYCTIIAKVDLFYKVRTGMQDIKQWLLLIIVINSESRQSRLNRPVIITCRYKYLLNTCIIIMFIVLKEYHIKKIKNVCSKLFNWIMLFSEGILTNGITLPSYN